MSWWMVRAGDNNELISKWLINGVVSIGWSDLGDPRKCATRDQLIQKANKVYSGDRPGAIIQWASQVWKYSREIKVGDTIISYAKDTRDYIIGSVTKEHEFNPNIIDQYYPNVILVKWENKRVSRDNLSQNAKNSLGGISTVFRVDQWGEELSGLLNGVVTAIKAKDDTKEEQEEKQSYEDFSQQALTMIEDRVDKLDPWQMQELVAGILKAMGYQARVSPKGRDGGIDILAHRDVFGFEQPIIKVQVKHRNSQSSAPEIQQLLGANPIGASSLFVSTGGFTSTARTVANQNNVRLIDLTDLVKLFIEWYENCTSETKLLVPLQRLYVPNIQPTLS